MRVIYLPGVAGFPKLSPALEGLGVDGMLDSKLFGELRECFTPRNGGYTRIMKSSHRVGDNAQTCVIEFLPA